MAKKPIRQDDAILRVAIFGTTDALSTLVDRAKMAHKMGVEPSWELMCTCMDMLCTAWQSNVTAAEAFGVIDLAELQNIISRVNHRSLTIKDILEAESGKIKRSDKQRLTDFKQTLSFLMGEIEDMAGSQPDHSDELMDVGSDLNDIEDRLEAVLTEMKDE